MTYDYLDVDPAVRANIESGSVENALYQIARYIDFLERENPDVNAGKLNKVQVSHDATTGAIRISASLSYTESIGATGDLIPAIVPFLVSA